MIILPSGQEVLLQRVGHEMRAISSELRNTDSRSALVEPRTTGGSKGRAEGGYDSQKKSV